MKQHSNLRLSILPDPLWVQPNRGQQTLSFDLWVQSQDSQGWFLRGMQLWVYDKSDQIILKRRLDEQALSPSIKTVGERQISPDGNLYLFNPFAPLDKHFPLHRLRCLLHFTSDDEQELTLSAEIFPKLHRQRAELSLPLKGPISVTDGHDYYAHHRRVSLSNPLVQKLGMKTNSQRYAWDFTRVNEHGYKHSGETDKSEGFFFRSKPSELNNGDFFGFGEPLFAPAYGTIIATQDHLQDDPPWKLSWTVEDFINDPSLAYGNYVLIDHGHNEYSMLGHCLQGSVRVKSGDRVKRGKVVAQLGNSGWSMSPHLHYQLMSGPNPLTAEGLPACFSDFDLIVGSKRIHIPYGAPETGEIIMGRD